MSLYIVHIWSHCADLNASPATFDRLSVPWGCLVVVVVTKLAPNHVVVFWFWWWLLMSGWRRNESLHHCHTYTHGHTHGNMPSWSPSCPLFHAETAAVVRHAIVRWSSESMIFFYSLLEDSMVTTPFEWVSRDHRCQRFYMDKIFLDGFSVIVVVQETTHNYGFGRWWCT